MPLLRYNAALDLPDWSAILARGPDAAAFLHGQLSNDMAHLDTDQARLAAYCNAKGRMLAGLIVLRYADAWALLLPAELLEPTRKRLGLFVLRARVVLSDGRSEGLGVLGLLDTTGDAGATPWQVHTLPEGVRLLKLPPAQGQARALALGPRAALAVLAANRTVLPRESWDGLLVQSGVVPIVAATVEHYLPQMLNYDLIGGVDFKKGCYPGQEIVARTHYLGKQKRRGALLRAAAPMQAGDLIIWSADPGQPCGEVALAAPLSSGDWVAFVEIKLDALGDARSRLHLHTPEGPVLQVQPLPYALAPSPADGRSALG